MKLNRKKLKEINGYLEGKIDAIDTETSSKALEYKKNFLKKFISINQLQIDERLGDGNYYVTRKYDGEFATIVYDNGEIVTINRSGRVRQNIPCIDEAAALLKKAGVKEAVIPAEIYVYDRDKRTRTNDLLTALGGGKEITILQLAVFDILELDGKAWKPLNYKETYQKITELFSKGKRVKPVDMEQAASNKQVKEIYHKWVEEGYSEGLVVRSDLPFVFKIKPRHTIDTVVIGFTEGTGDQRGQVRTMLLAMRREDGLYQVVSHIGGGMPAELKKQMFEEFSAKIVKSDFIDTDSNHIAFRMIEPGTVLEMNINDVIYETANGPIINAVLDIEDGVYKQIETVEGMSFIAPIFERFRQDKSAEPHDVRLSQIEDFSSVEPGETVAVANEKTEKSKLLHREVYRKELGSKVMVQKYLVWKTNKEHLREYPAYVFHYTNFSSERIEPLQRDVTISDDYGQIVELMKKAMETNVKKGWVKMEGQGYTVKGKG